MLWLLWRTAVLFGLDFVRDSFGGPRLYVVVDSQKLGATHIPLKVPAPVKELIRQATVPWGVARLSLSERTLGHPWLLAPNLSGVRRLDRLPRESITLVEGPKGTLQIPFMLIHLEP
jgi:hypothetical protein